jgi:hypothetical protein
VEIMAAIVRDEPEPLEGKIPVPLKWLVDRCLEKDPTRRFDSTRDLYQQLRTMRDHFSEAYTSGVQALLPEVAQAGAKRKEFSVRTAIAMAALAAVLAGACAWWLHPSGVQLAKYKYTPFAVNAGSPLWSPDGKTAAYAGIVGDDRELFLRRLDSPMPQQLTSAPGFARPIGWSPDSSHIYYIERAPGADSGTVLSIASVGGEPDVLWTLPPMNISGWQSGGSLLHQYCRSLRHRNIRSHWFAVARLPGFTRYGEKHFRHSAVEVFTGRQEAIAYPRRRYRSRRSVAAAMACRQRNSAADSEKIAA